MSVCLVTLWVRLLVCGMEDDLRWKTTFRGRRLLVEDDPCMLPSWLCCIFVYDIAHKNLNNSVFSCIEMLDVYEMINLIKIVKKMLLPQFP